MKKLLVIIMVLFFAVGMVIPSFAQTAPAKKSQVTIEVIHGTVVSIDAAKKEIVVKEVKTGQDKTFVVSEKAISLVKTGDKVKLRVKAGSNVAESVKVVNPPAKKK